MLMMPLPFFIAFALGLYLLHEVLADRDQSLARQGFLWLIGLCALHAVMIGLVWGYGLNQLRPVLPVTASLLPVMAWLGFRALIWPQSGPGMSAIALRLLPTLAILLAHAVLPEAIDGLLIAIFLGHGIVLWRMSGTSPDALTGTALQDTARVHRAMRLAALVLWSNVVVDLAILADYVLADGQHVPPLLSLFSVAVLLALGGLAVLGSEVAPVPEAEGEASQPDSVSPEDLSDTVRRVDAFLRESRLYTQPDLTLSRIARRLSVPAREVSTAINRHHGVNVSQYVNGFRLDEACRLLAETDLSVTDVHLEAGFQTKSNFNREFRRQYGQSPSEWRAQRRASGEGHDRSPPRPSPAPPPASGPA